MNIVKRFSSSHTLRVLAVCTGLWGALLLEGCSVVVAENPGLGIGSVCQTDQDCHAGYCLRSPRIPQSGICAARCDAQVDCPSGSECVAGACHVPLTVGVAMTGNPAESEGWTYAHVQGLQDAAKEFGYVQLDNHFGLVPGNVVEDLRKMAAKNRLILGNSVDYISDFKQAARENPNHNFLCVDDGVYMTGSDNFTTYWIHRVQAWYIAGKLAAQAVQANVTDKAQYRLGVISAFVNPETVAAVNAFTLGAKSIHKDFVVEVRHVGFWFDPSNMASFVYEHQKASGDKVSRTYFREEYLAAQLVDSGCKIIAHLTNTQRSVRLIEELTKSGLTSGFVASMANDNEQGCRDTKGDWTPTCFAAIYENWRPLYRDLFEKKHFGVFDAKKSLDYDMTDTQETPTGVRLNPAFKFPGVDPIAATQLQQDFARSKPIPSRQRVFMGPYDITNQRDSNQDGIPDRPELQKIKDGELLSVAESAKMCWYVKGVVEKDPASGPRSMDRDAQVPGGLAVGSSLPNVLYTPSDLQQYSIPKDLHWECTKNSF